MLTDNYKDLAVKARKIFTDSLDKTLELFPLDDATKKKYDELPSAIGETTSDFGSPAKHPFEVYLSTLPRSTLENITEKDPVELLKDLKEKKISCVEVLTAYFHAAVVASKLTNCVQEFLPVEALEFAKKLDENYETMKDLPLYGLPFSIKEMIPFKGRAVTHGSLCYLDRVVDYNADIVNILMENGAYPFVRTTNPQSLMMLECQSFCHGRTVNAFNSDLTSGGSSGGEGVLNGLYASPFGLGSDIGGSIRSPAGFNGIYGLRTTLGRIPTADYYSCQMGSESILSVTGPISRSLDTVNLVMKTIIDAKPWLVDPTLVPIEWSPKPKKKYRVGVLLSDEVVNPTPPIKRALQIVQDKLKDSVELVPFKPYHHEKTPEILGKLYFEDGARDFRSTLETGEPLLEQTTWAIDGAEDLDMHEQWKWNLEKQKYRKEYLKHWNTYTDEEGNILDAVIAPLYPNVAPKHGIAQYWTYTSQWNLLDYPVLVFPVTIVDEKLDQPEKSYSPINDMDKFIHDQYDDPKSFAKAPVNLCIIGLRNTDEKLVEIAKITRKEIGDIFA
ncbi:putative amidase [Candida tropicalis]